MGNKDLLTLMLGKYPDLGITTTTGLNLLLVSLEKFNMDIFKIIIGEMSSKPQTLDSESP